MIKRNAVRRKVKRYIFNTIFFTSIFYIHVLRKKEEKNKLAVTLFGGLTALIFIYFVNLNSSIWYQRWRWDFIYTRTSERILMILGAIFRLFLFIRPLLLWNQFIMNKKFNLFTVLRAILAFVNVIPITGIIFDDLCEICILKAVLF